MSKEEILEKETSGVITEHEGGITGIFNAMDEYAKQVAMAYFDWGVEQILPGSIPKEPSEDTMKARENLYKKFIESQNK